MEAAGRLAKAGRAQAKAGITGQEGTEDILPVSIFG